MKGTISINRWTGNGEQHEGVRIELTDETSHISFGEINMNVEDFARALFGSSYQSCDYTLRGIESIGKVYENKTVKIKTDGSPYRYTKEQAIELISPHLVDGWMSTDEGYYDFKNPHNWAGDFVSINIHRYV